MNTTSQTKSTFINPSTGERISTSDKTEIKRMKLCGWQKVKIQTQVFAKGLQNGKSFLN